MRCEVRSRARGLFAALIILSMGAAVPATAGPIFEVRVGGGLGEFAAIVTSSSPVSIPLVSFDSGTGVGQASGFSGIGSLGAFGYAKNEGLGTGAVGGATASLSFAFTIVGPPELLVVPVSMSLDVSGEAKLLNAPGQWALGLEVFGSLGRVNTTGSLGDVLSSGLLSGFTGAPFDTTLTTPVRFLSPGFEQTVEIIVQAMAGADGGGGEAVANFASTVSFPRGVPLFNLPDGYTVNVPELFIVDNFFVPPTAVPEPGVTLLLAVGGLGALAARRRRAG